MAVRMMSAGCGAIMLASMPCAVNAQAWIGQVVGNVMAQQAAAQQEYECMTGTAMPPDEIVEATVPATELMRKYWAAGASGQPVNLADYFHLSKKAEWKYGEKKVLLAVPNTATDPFASMTAKLDGEPLATRSGDGSSAYIQWAARDQNDKLSGTYQGRLTRQSGVWKLSTLELFGAKDYVEPIVPYCHKIGDVLPYRLADTERMLDRAEKTLLKRQAKAAKAEAAAAKAKGQNVTLANEKAAKAQQELVIAQESVVATRKLNADVKAEADMLEQRRIAKKAELAAAN